MVVLHATKFSVVSVSLIVADPFTVNKYLSPLLPIFTFELKVNSALVKDQAHAQI